VPKYQPVADRHEAFIQAYLGEAHRNATQAALLAGYAPASAAQQGCELLKHPKVAPRIRDVVERQSISVTRALENLSALAETSLVNIKITARDVIAANELILKAHGALLDKRPDARVTVHIGFLPTLDGVQPAITIATSDAQALPDVLSTALPRLTAGISDPLPIALPIAADVPREVPQELRRRQSVDVAGDNFCHPSLSPGLPLEQPADIEV
jgi:hypothetical protein